jgi:hypothetical protein
MIFEAFKKVFIFLFLNVLVTVFTFIAVLSLVYGEFPPPIMSISKQLAEIRKFAKAGLNLQFYKENRANREAILSLADGVSPNTSGSKVHEDVSNAHNQNTVQDPSSGGLFGKDSSEESKINRLFSELNVQKMKIQSLENQLKEQEEAVQALREQVGPPHADPKGLIRHK